MKKDKTARINFVCFLVASVCFYISGIIGIFIKVGSNWVVNLCLGSSFLCLSTSHLNKEIITILTITLMVVASTFNLVFYILIGDVNYLISKCEKDEVINCNL